MSKQIDCSLKVVVVVVTAATLLVLVGSTVLKVNVYTAFKPEKCPEQSRRRNLVTVHYIGSTLDGNVFDSSRDRNQPFTFRLGMSDVMLGLDQGLFKMCVGEKRILSIPPDYATGKTRYRMTAPKGVVLRYEVELLKLAKSPPLDAETFKEADLNEDMKLSREEVRNHHVKLLELWKSKGDIKDNEVEDEQQELDQVVEHLFHEGDKDGDGFISYAELLGHKKIESVKERLLVYILNDLKAREALGKELDENHKEFLKKSDFIVEQIFMQNDEDKDGFISEEEFFGSYSV